MCFAFESMLLCVSPQHSRPGQRLSRRSRSTACRAAGDAPPSSRRNLEDALREAVSREDYAAAAALRDQLAFVKRDETQGVEAANAAFYAAFSSMDLAAMDRLWGVGDAVRCTHPGASCILGRDAVMASWAHVFRRGGRMAIRAEQLHVHAAGTLGFVTLLEVVDSGDATGRLECTNIFEQQEGVWRMVHHHATPAPRI